MKCMDKDMKQEVCQKCDHAIDGHKKNKYCIAICASVRGAHKCVPNNREIQENVNTQTETRF